MLRVFVGVLIVLSAANPARAEWSIGLFADPWGRVGAECVSANQPFEVYLVALRDGGTLEALEVGVEGLESSGLVLLEEELLARDLTVRTEDDARIYSAEFSSCRGPDVHPLVRLVLLSTAPGESGTSLCVTGVDGALPSYRDCDGQAGTFALDTTAAGRVEPGCLRLQLDGLCCPVADYALDAYDGVYPFPPVPAVVEVVYSVAGPNDTLGRILCDVYEVYGLRARVRFDPADVTLDGVEVRSSTALTAWNFTATPIEPGVVELEWRDPASVEGFGDTPLDGPAWFDLLFERVDSFGETSITIDEAAVCLTAITDELDWPCGWTAAGGTSASILESVRGEAQSFGTLKARFHERSAGVPRR